MKAIFVLELIACVANAGVSILLFSRGDAMGFLNLATTAVLVIDLYRTKLHG